MKYLWETDFDPEEGVLFVYKLVYMNCPEVKTGSFETQEEALLFADHLNHCEAGI